MIGGALIWHGVRSSRDVDARLVIGPALFGVGWGLAGYCPGPAVTSLGSGNVTAIVFVLAMLAGMALYAGIFEAAWLPQLRSAGAADREPSRPWSCLASRR